MYQSNPILSLSCVINFQIDFEEDELLDLLEDAPPMGLPTLRPRSGTTRLLPRTRQTERVRARIRSRRIVIRETIDPSPQVFIINCVLKKYI